MTINYISQEDRSKLLWEKLPDIPLIILPLGNSHGYGHIKNWIEENILNEVNIIIEDYGQDNLTSFGVSSSSSGEILIVFLTQEDYTAFKLMFPEYC